MRHHTSHRATANARGCDTWIAYCRRLQSLLIPIVPEAGHERKVNGGLRQ